VPNRAYAKDFGKIANCFKVKEEGFVLMIKNRVKSFVLSNKHKNLILNPSKLEFHSKNYHLEISNTKKPRSFYYDPTYVLKKDIRLPSGEFLYKAGTKVNPLQNLNLNRKIFFINGNCSKQINWLKNQLKLKQEDDLQNRVILISGDISFIQEKLGIDVYFDYFGEIVKKFKIKQVPAIAVQEGLLLKIEEILLK
jgi:conjugal transfer pilus assembly protein TraW